MLGSRLARHADRIATQTGLGGLWIGSVLLAASTSLPEVLTDINAAVLDAPDIGVGDLLGSTLANMLILAALDIVFARRRILSQVAVGHTLLGLLGILLTAMAGVAIVTGGWGRVGHVGIETVAIAATYLGGMRLLYGSAAVRPPSGERPEEGGERENGLRRAAVSFSLATVGLAVVTPLLVLSADAVSREARLGPAFVGTLLVGLTTSFPEMAATVSAVRMGALDLAVGNIFGSNAFNMLVLLVMDAAYVRGPLLSVVAGDHLLTVLLAITCLALGITAILSRAQRRPGPAILESALIVATYVLGAWLLYRQGRP
jgi:cation:H+ antiporter